MDQNRLHLSWVKKTTMSGFLGGKCIYKKGHFRLFFLVSNPHQISLTTCNSIIDIYTISELYPSEILSKFVAYLMSFKMTSVDNEQLYSTLKYIRSSHKSRMSLTTLKTRLYCKYNDIVLDCVQMDKIEPDLNKRLNLYKKCLSEKPFFKNKTKLN